MAIYYVLQGSIYQCPDLQLLLSNRIFGSLHYVESAFNEARVATEFHPSTGYHWKTIQPETTSAAPGASIPSTSVAPAAPGNSTAVAVSRDFRVAVDLAIRTVENREKTKQQISGNAGLNVSGASSSTDPKIKQEGVPANASAAAKNAPKAQNKRRKKSEEASAAAASMGINTNMGAGTTQGRLPSAGVQSAGPTTPGSTQPKKRKKTKTMEK
ncbi:Mediator of RNA polymerase II transcription subunit 6 [Entomortierella beljakovae]|nr:Mediator of RNA polymerase II transcription subunit 6 [Entomortierella beljakovae]